MGLAAWGALGGVGKGMEMNIQRKVEDRRSDLENAREMRLREYENEQKGKRQEAGFEHETGLQEKKGEQATGLQAQKAEHDITKMSREQAFEAEQAALDRAAEKEVAGIKATGKTGKGWKVGKQKSSEIDPEGGIRESEINVITDEGTGLTYIQKGRKFVPQDPDQSVPVRQAPREAVQYLINNPNDANAFLEAYGYLPIEFMSVAK